MTTPSGSFRGGFPQAVARSSPRRRERFFDSYVADLVMRDVSQLSEIERLAEMRALLRLLAARSGQLLIANSLGNDLRLSSRSVHRYLGLLEEVYLVKRVPSRTTAPRTESKWTPSWRTGEVRVGHALVRPTAAGHAGQRTVGDRARGGKAAL